MTMSRASQWEDYQYGIAVLDGDIYCDDDQSGVVINAASQDALEHWNGDRANTTENYTCVTCGFTSKTGIHRCEPATNDVHKRINTRAVKARIQELIAECIEEGREEARKEIDGLRAEREIFCSRIDHLNTCYGFMTKRAEQAERALEMERAALHDAQIDLRCAERERDEARAELAKIKYGPLGEM